MRSHCVPGTKLYRRYSPSLERIEDRVLPGETIGWLLLSPLDLVADRPAAAQAPAPRVAPQAAAVAPAIPFDLTPVRPAAVGGYVARPGLVAPPSTDGTDDLLDRGANVLGGGGPGGPEGGSSIVWLNSWGVYLDGRVEGGQSHADYASAFGFAATRNGDITDVGNPGDEGPASAAARSRSQAGANVLGSGYGQSEVYFWRTLELSGTATAWYVSLEGILAGRLCCQEQQAAYAQVRIIEGFFEGYTEEPDTATTHLVNFGLQNRDGTFRFTRGDEREISPGTYTVMGTLTTATVPAGECQIACSTRADFFEPAGFVVSVDAIPLD